jgi:hypothetical protein
MSDLFAALNSALTVGLAAAILFVAAAGAVVVLAYLGAQRR